MKLLVFDTSLNACSVAILDTLSGYSLARFRSMKRGHVEALMPMIAEVMSAAELSFTDIDRFAVTIGPGSFTGLRVGLAAGRGFSLATIRPLVGVGTLDVLAKTALSGSSAPDGPFMIALHATGDEVYCQRFDEHGEPVDSPCVKSASMAAADMGTNVHPRLFGTGASLIASALPSFVSGSIECVDTLDACDPVELALLAATAVPDRVRLLYLRPISAKPQPALS